MHIVCLCVSCSGVMSVKSTEQDCSSEAKFLIFCGTWRWIVMHARTNHCVMYWVVLNYLSPYLLKCSRLRWSRDSLLAFGTQVRGFEPGRSRRIFRGEKILSTPSFGREVNPSVPCRSFTACKRSLNVTCKSTFRQNIRTFFAHSSTFRRWVLSRGDTRRDVWWRMLERLTQIAQ